MGLNMSRVDISELMREMYYSVMGWFTRVGGVGGVTFYVSQLNDIVGQSA